jgi:regulatory protein
LSRVDDGSSRGDTPRRRSSFQERRERRAAVEDLAEVLDAAARQLEARPRSVSELRRRLTTAGYREHLVDAAIVRLGELGYLDDEAFARAWVESRDRAHPRGEHALRRELRLKGIDANTIEGVLAMRRAGPEGGEPASDAAAADPDAAAAARLLERHARALGRVADPRARRQRAYVLLARNGFDTSIATDAARRFVDADAGAGRSGPGPADEPTPD